MKNSRMKMTAVLMVATFMFTGCGEALYELEPDEETAIVGYAAHAVAKYNTYQQDGEVPVSAQEETEQTADTEQAVQEQDTEAGSEQAGPDVTADTAGGSQGGENGGSTLNDAFDLGVIQAQYEGQEICSVYEQSDSYTIDAMPGNKLLVLKVNLTNTSDIALNVNILGMTPQVRAILNGDTRVPAQTSILPNDLTTYVRENDQAMQPGETAETVLIFEIPEDMTEITSIQLKINMNGQDFTVNL